jgi:tripartite-type tricarboxylate transporter receptor subunit TctC
VFTTAGTPAPVLQKLHDAYKNALSDPAVIERLKLMGSNADSLTPAQFADMVRLEREKYKEIVTVSGAKAN